MRWLAAISGMSSAQRAEAFATLEKRARATPRGGGVFRASAGQAGASGGRAWNDEFERVEAQGCPHCAGREIVGWGRSQRAVAFRCKSCGRTFNALTKTPMAHLRKKEKWPAHARDDRGQERGQDRATVRRSSDDGLPLAASVSARACRQQAARCAGSSKRTKPSSSNPSKAGAPTCRAARKRGGKARHPVAFPDNIPVLVARDRKGATFDAVLPQVDGGFHRRRACRNCRAGNHLIGDGGRPIAAFARRAGIPFHAVPSPGSRCPANPHPHQQRQRLPPAPQGMADPLQRRRHQELPDYLGWRRALEALGRPTRTAKRDQGAIRTGHTTVTPTRASFPIVVVQEAGPRRLLAHRVLQSEGTESHVVDPASIATSRRRRRAKTDSIDGEAMLRALLAFKCGDLGAAMVKAPTPEEETAAALSRPEGADRRAGHARQPHQGAVVFPGRFRLRARRRDRRQRLDGATTGDGRSLPIHLKTQISRELDRLRSPSITSSGRRPNGDALLAAQQATAPRHRGGRRPSRGASGAEFAASLWLEALFRSFDNGRQLASYAGQRRRTPWQSGSSVDREQGVSKAGKFAITNHPHSACLAMAPPSAASALACGPERVNRNGGRLKKSTIVALVRKLSVALWKNTSPRASSSKAP